MSKKKTVASPTAARTASETTTELVPTAKKALSQVDAELARDAGKRHSSIDSDRVVPHHLELRTAVGIDPSLLKPKAPIILPGLLVSFDRAFARLEDARRALGSAVPTQRVYSKATRSLAKDTCFPLFKEIRDYSGDRLKHVPGVEDLRLQLGTNGGVSGDNPQETLTGMDNQLQALQSERWAETIEDAGLYPEPWIERLAELVPKLRESIKGGVVHETKLGDARTEEDLALLELDICLSRAAAYLAPFGPPGAAQKLEDLVPRKAVTEPTTMPEPAPQGGSSTDGKNDNSTTGASSESGGNASASDAPKTDSAPSNAPGSTGPSDPQDS